MSVMGIDGLAGINKQKQREAGQQGRDSERRARVEKEKTTRTGRERAGEGRRINELALQLFPEQHFFDLLSFSHYLGCRNDRRQQQNNEKIRDQNSRSARRRNHGNQALRDRRVFFLASATKAAEIPNEALVHWRKAFKVMLILLTHR